MKPPKSEPLPLSDVIRDGYVAPTPPKDAPERVLRELEGDAALSQGRFADALTAYMAAKGTSWRLRSKIGMCCHQMDRWIEGEKFLAEAPERKDPIALSAYIDCVARANKQSPERASLLTDLTRTLLNLAHPSVYAFECARLYLTDHAERARYLAAGRMAFPENPSIRRAYLSALWRSGEYEEPELLDLVAACTSQETALPEDFWLGHKVLNSLKRYSDAVTVLVRLVGVSNEPEIFGVVLALADTLLIAGETTRAQECYRALVEEAPKPEHGMLDIAMSAARGQIKIALEAKNQAGIEAGVAALYNIFKQYGYRGLVNQGNPLQHQPIEIAVGTLYEWYAGLADLSEMPVSVAQSISDPDLRAWLKVAYATIYDREGVTLEDARELILEAGGESSSPYIQREVGMALMEVGRFEEAGKSFGRLEWAQISFMPGQWSSDDDDTLFSEPPYDNANVVSQFASGMAKELFGSASRSRQWFPGDVHEVLESYVRDPLINFKLYDQFHSLMKSVIGLYDFGKGEPTASEWFDYGLACHYKLLNEDAADAYRSCLALQPDHEAARANLMMVMPAKARKMLVVEEHIHRAATKSSTLAMPDLTLEQAVYLMALYRACGGAEQDLTLRPFGENEYPFVPTVEMRAPLLSLVDEGLLHFSKQSPLEAFVLDESGKEVSAYILDRMCWDVPVSTMAIIKDIQDACLGGDWPEHWLEQVPGLMHQLARHECLAYLRECGEERKMRMPSGEKTLLMIDNLLTTFSVAQAYAIFWQGATAASDYLQRESVSAAQAANTIVGNCQRRADRARSEGWVIKPYGRPKSVRRSEFSYTFHDAFLGIGEQAFTVPLRDLLIPQAVQTLAAVPKTRC